MIILSFIAITPDYVHLDIISLSTGSQLPASIPVYNGPVAGGTSLLQAFLNVGSQPATNVTPLPPPVGSAQRLSAPLSPGGALSNGPSSQHPLSVVSNSTQMGFSQPGSALTSVMSSQSSHPSLLQGAMGTPMQRQLNANLQQSQLGQNASPPQSSLPTGQDQGPPPQTSGMFPTSAPEGAQALSALHSKKSKRRVRRTDTGYPGKHNQQLGQNASPPQSSLPTGQDQGPPPQTSGMFPTSAPEGAQALSALHSKKSKRRVRRTDTGYPGKHNQQLGQSASPPQSSLPTGQDQGPPPQTSGMFPTCKTNEHCQISCSCLHEAPIALWYSMLNWFSQGQLHVRIPQTFNEFVWVMTISHLYHLFH